MPCNPQAVVVLRVCRYQSVGIADVDLCHKEAPSQVVHEEDGINRGVRHMGKLTVDIAIQAVNLRSQVTWAF